jgi:single-strand DNA-binding protein
MQNVLVGNLCQDPVLRQPFRGSRPYAKFTVAVNIQRRIGDEYVDRPTVFHRVVCFGQLAENVSNSLRKGMEVLAVGEWVDDSYSDDQGKRHVQVAMEARTLGPTLRWATVQVHRTERRSDTGTADLFATDRTRPPAPDPTAPDPTPQSATRTADPAALPVPDTPAAGPAVIRGLPTASPDADARGGVRRRKKAEPEPAISQAG